jgi:UDP-N-acetylglucosamine 4,6-dehydratase
VREIQGKTILITGGTGTFGSAVTRRLISNCDCSVIIFSRDEKKQDDARNYYRNSNVSFVIGDVRDYSSIHSAMHGVDFVFHAAALKQVPSCDFFPIEATKTNILGAANVINSAIASNVKSIVVLSTDKAVYPINAMGMSKALMEKVAIASSRNSNTRVCITRYGNVLASRGSVIPLFFKQIQEGKPLTITDPRMTRFLMSIEEAVDLVLHALQQNSNGSLFVKQSPAATVENIAKAVSSVCGHDNYPLHYIGTRHGEKLYETLLSREEMAIASDSNGYYHVPPDSRSLNYASYYTEGLSKVDNLQDFNSHNAQRLSLEEVKQLVEPLKSLSLLD